MSIGAKSLLYSTGTLLAYKIAEKYYGNTHYVWCATKFNFGLKQPESSNPSSICRNFLNAIATQDRHSDIINNNKNGILRGASSKRSEGLIGDKEELEIRAIVTNASFAHFMPVIYVINACNVLNQCVEVPIKDKAASHSVEYIIRELPRDKFDIISMRDILRDINGNFDLEAI